MIFFISSTAYDLQDARPEIAAFLKEKGHETILSDGENFSVDIKVHRQQNCINNVYKCDFFILIISQRFGAPFYKDSKISITWAEFNEAVRLNKKIILFVRERTLHEMETYRVNKKAGIMIKLAFVEDAKVFDFIEVVQAMEGGYQRQPFRNTQDIKKYMENIFKTNEFKPISQTVLNGIRGNEIPLTFFSGSTASYLSDTLTLNKDNKVTKEQVKLAIDKIPLSLHESIGKPNENSGMDSSDWIYKFQTIDNGIRINETGATALGFAVRSELSNVLQVVKNANQDSLYFIDVLKRTPIFCQEFEDDKVKYIIGFYEERKFFGNVLHLCLLHFYLNKWQLKYDLLLDKNFEDSELSGNTELIPIGKKIYLYFERIIQHGGTMNHGRKELRFTVFDIQTKELNTLTMEGRLREGCIEGEVNLDTQEYKKFKTIFEKKLSECNLIYRTPADYNINEPKNCIEKWNVDNADFFSNDNGKIRFFYYDVDIGQQWKNPICKSENSKFIVSSYFAGPIFGKNLVDGRYFIILVPQGLGFVGGSWGIRSYNYLKFLSDNLIHLQDGTVAYEINLENLSYQKSKRIETK